jgi:hypothetical protein
MNRLSRREHYSWDPFKELETTGNRFNRLMGQLPMRYEVGREAMSGKSRSNRLRGEPFSEIPGRCPPAGSPSPPGAATRRRTAP